jgi:hypothetical protein
MAELLARINTMIESESHDLAQIERTLTDGYAAALSLEAERWRLERRMAEVVARGIDQKEAEELASLSQRLNGNQGRLASLRAVLADLRRHMDRVRTHR